MSNSITRIKAAILLRGGEKEYKTLFTLIWNYYYPRLMVYIKNFWVSGPVDDIAQEILTKVWIHLSSYNPLYSLSTWIYTIARNHIIDMRREKKISCTAIHEHESNSVINSRNQSPEEIFFQNLEKEYISRFLDTLGENDREIIYLRFYEQQKLKNIAAIMNLPIGTVKYRLHSVKKKLSIFLEGVYEEEKN